MAKDLSWSEALIWEDKRFMYDEIRMNSIVPKGDTLYFVTFTYRDDRMRIISLRHSNNAEKRYYVESIY
ncbi:MAG: BrnT family toxin [Azoarcus sp.]|nr:BrnT family toxin [Azoarcus sp.]